MKIEEAKHFLLILAIILSVSSFLKAKLNDLNKWNLVSNFEETLLSVSILFIPDFLDFVSLNNNENKFGLAVFINSKYHKLRFLKNFIFFLIKCLVAVTCSAFYFTLNTHYKDKLDLSNPQVDKNCLFEGIFWKS